MHMCTGSPLDGSVLIQDVQREAQEVVSPPNWEGGLGFPFLGFPLVLICKNIFVAQLEFAQGGPDL